MSNSICGAKTRTGTPCELRAGWGTDHVGEGRCKLHGGRTPRGTESPHFRHGGRSKYFDPSSIIGFDEWRATIGPTLELEDDLLAMIFQVREMVLRREPVTVMTKAGPVEIKPDAEYISKCLGRITAAWERMVKRREGETIYVRLAQPEMEAAFAAVGDAIGKHVSDPAEVEAVVSAIEATLEAIDRELPTLADA